MDERVLVADDDEAVLGVISLAITQMGFEVVEARSGEEALDLLTDERIGLVVTNHAMPGMSGLELISEVRQMRGMLPVLFVSGNFDDETVRQARALGGVRVLAKPFSIATLRANIEALRADGVPSRGGEDAGTRRRA